MRNLGAVVLFRIEVGKFNIDYFSTLSILLFMLGTENHIDIWQQGVTNTTNITFRLLICLSLTTLDQIW